MTPHEGLKRAIERWEGLYQAQPQDLANFVPMPDGSRKLVGTMRGVTPATLAAHRGIHPWDVTADMMKAVTLDEAAEIGLTRFYQGTGLDRLPWGPATEALVDFGWGSGPAQAVRSMQRLCGVSADGVVGPATINAYAAWVARVGWEQATKSVADMRKAFYDLIISKHPAWEMYRKGWYNRANWMTPDSADWWAPWSKNYPPLPIVVTGKAIAPKTQEPPPILPPRDQPSDSETVKDANLGKVLTGAAGAATASAPVVQAIAGADWKIAAIFAAVAIVAIVAGFLLFHKRGKRRKAEIALGVGD